MLSNYLDLVCWTFEGKTGAGGEGQVRTRVRFAGAAQAMPYQVTCTSRLLCGALILSLLDTGWVELGRALANMDGWRLEREKVRRMRGVVASSLLLYFYRDTGVMVIDLLSFFYS